MLGICWRSRNIRDLDEILGCAHPVPCDHPSKDLGQAMQAQDAPQCAWTDRVARKADADPAHVVGRLQPPYWSTETGVVWQPSFRTLDEIPLTAAEAADAS